MLIPDQLWVPSAKDSRSQFAPVAFNSRGDTTDTSATIRASMRDLEVDSVLIASSIMVLALAGGAQVVTDVNVSIVDEADNTICELYDSTTAAAEFLLNQSVFSANPAQFSKTLLGEFVVLGGQRIQALCTFDAGVSNNRVVLAVHGALSPRGNWQRG